MDTFPYADLVNPLASLASQVVPSAAPIAGEVGGIALNVATLAVVTALVGSLAGAIVYLFKSLTAGMREENIQLRIERDALLERLFEVVATADRATAAGERAGALLTPRTQKARRS